MMENVTPIVGRSDTGGLVVYFGNIYLPYYGSGIDSAIIEYFCILLRCMDICVWEREKDPKPLARLPRI